jgi:hypothetical protein
MLPYILGHLSPAYGLLPLKREYEYFGGFVDTFSFRGVKGFNICSFLLHMGSDGRSSSSFFVPFFPTSSFDSIL